MTGVPPDVHETITQLIAEAREDIREGETDAAADVMKTAETVARNKVPDPETGGRLAHGADAVARLAGDDPAVATEYLRAMERQLEE